MHVDFVKELNLRAERANNMLNRFILPKPFQSIPLVEVMRYGTLLGGKRLRPFLVYATGNMFGISDTTLDAPAAAIECIHAYSLIHDDLPAIDNENIRRGQKTCHIRFGEAKAILAGDALQMLAFSILSDAPMTEVTDLDRLAMISELAMASGIAGMCSGQALDLDARNSQVNLEYLERVHRYKTGALIRAAVRLGALSAGDTGRGAFFILDKYAESIGLAFQVHDDILDIADDTIKSNKRHSSSLQLSKKNTYPGLLGLKQAKRKARDLVNDAHQSLALLAAKSFDTSALEALAEYIIQRDK